MKKGGKETLTTAILVVVYRKAGTVVVGMRSGLDESIAHFSSNAERKMLRKICFLGLSVSLCRYKYNYTLQLQSQSQCNAALLMVAGARQATVSRLG